MTSTLELTNRQKLIDELKFRSSRNPLLTHALMSMQRAFQNDPSKEKYGLGGNRSGKTECFADYVMRKGRATQNFIIWVVGETFSDSVNIQQKKIWQLLPKHEAKYCKYNEITGFSNRKLLLQNGTMYVFKSYDQGREAFQGEKVDIVWNDEEPPLDIYREEKMRLIDNNGEMLISMTSLKGVTELVEEIFEGYSSVKTEYAPLADKELPRIADKNGKRLYFFWTTENPHIDQARLSEEIKLMDKQEITCRIYGVPVNLSGRIYPKFSSDIHVVSADDIDIGDCQLWNILDPHDRKPWAIGWFAVSKTGHAAAICEYPDRNFNEMLFDDKTVADYAALIKKTEKTILSGVRNKLVKRIIDPNFGNSTRIKAEREGGQSKTTVKSDLAKHGLVYSDGIDMLEQGHIKVREWLHWAEKDGELIVFPKLVISDVCQNIIKHLSRYSRKDIYGVDGDVKNNVKPREEFKDFSDLIRYFVMANPRYILPQEFKPKEGRAY